MSKICAIISGGNFSPLLNIENSDYIIACDKGYEYAKKAGILPNLIIGDFDSCREEPPEKIPVLSLPEEKDDTDTMSAIRYAVAHNFDELFIYCALGGRLDHTVGNIQSASYAASKGLTVRIIDSDNELCIFSDNEIIFPKRDNCSISVLSLSDKCDGVSVTGGKYKLENATVTNIFPIGISNEWTDSISVSVKTGIIAVIMSGLDR